MTEQTQKKYELLKDDTVNHHGRTLYRIKALITFGTVVAGELGGYIETEKNLDHSGNAWVYGNAQVRSFAFIYERKMIFSASNVGSENGTLTVFNGKDGLIVTRGCFARWTSFYQNQKKSTTTKLITNTNC